MSLSHLTHFRQARIANVEPASCAATPAILALEHHQQEPNVIAVIAELENPMGNFEISLFQGLVAQLDVGFHSATLRSRFAELPVLTQATGRVAFCNRK